MDRLQARVEAVRAGTESPDHGILSDCIAFIHKQTTIIPAQSADTTLDTSTHCAVLEDLYVNAEYVFVSMYRHMETSTSTTGGGGSVRLLDKVQALQLWQALLGSSFMSTVPVVDQTLSESSALFEQWKGPRKGVFILGQLLGCLLAEDYRDGVVDSTAFDCIDPSTAIVSLAVHMYDPKAASINDVAVGKALPLALPWIIDILQSPFCALYDGDAVSNAIGIRSVIRDLLFRVIAKYEHFGDDHIVDMMLMAMAGCHRDSEEMCDSMWLSETWRELMVWLVEYVLLDDRGGTDFGLIRLSALMAAVSASRIGAQQVVDLVSRLSVIVVDRTSDRHAVVEQTSLSQDGSVLYLLQVKDDHDLSVPIGDGDSSSSSLVVILPAGTTGSQRGDHCKVKWNVAPYCGFELMYRHLLVFLDVLHGLVYRQRQSLPRPQIVPLFAVSKVPDLHILVAHQIRNILDNTVSDARVLTCLLELLGALIDNHSTNSTTNSISSVVSELDLLSDTPRGLLSLLPGLDRNDALQCRFMAATIRLCRFDAVISMFSHDHDHDLDDSIVVSLAHSYTNSSVPPPPAWFIDKVIRLLHVEECVKAALKMVECQPDRVLVDLQSVIDNLPLTTELLKLLLTRHGVVLTGKQLSMILERAPRVLDSASSTSIIGQLQAHGLLERAVELCKQDCHQFILTVCHYLAKHTCDSDDPVYRMVITHLRSNTTPCGVCDEGLLILGKHDDVSGSIDNVKRVLDQDARLCRYIPWTADNVSVLLERPECLDHVDISSLAPIICNVVITADMLPSVLKFPQLLQLTMCDSPVVIDLLDDPVMMTGSVVDVMLHIPSHQSALLLHHLQSTSHLTGRLFHRDCLCDRRMARVAGKHQAVWWWLVIEMGWLEAVASVSVGVLYGVMLDYLLTDRDDAQCAIPQVILHRMATVLLSTHNIGTTTTTDWLAVAVALLDRDAGTIRVMFATSGSIGADSSVPYHDDDDRRSALLAMYQSALSKPC